MASATNTFTNNAADHAQEWYSADGELTNRVWINSAGQTNRAQSFSWDARGRLHGMTDLDNTASGYTWTAVYDGLGRRLQTATVMVTNGASVTALPKIINQYFDPSAEFLELGETDNGVATWKIYGPDLNGAYGGMNGVGGLEAVASGIGAPSPIVSDIRGNGYAVYNVPQANLTWYSSRPTGFGAVPGYRVLPLGDGAEVAAASAWRGKWSDISGLYWLGARYYNPVAGRFLGAEPLGHDADPSLYTFCGGDPINSFDSNGRLASSAFNYGYGVLQGLDQGYFGTSEDRPTSTANFDGQASGRSLAGATAALITLGGTINTGTGLGLMALSGGAEVVTAGASTPLSVPGLAGGGLLTLEGTIQIGVGGYGLYNYMNLPPLQSPSSDSGGGGGGGASAGNGGEPSGQVASQPGTLTGSLAGRTPAEISYAQEQLAAGNNVEIVPTSNVPTPDFKINGVETELKTVNNLGPNTVKNFIESAAEQTSQQIVIDARNVNVSPADAAEQIQRAQGNIGGLQGRVTVLTSKGPVKF
ncbi:MAG TPA: RHS repeat-associated core domain-containing protein [Verrucomicrobiae bacterium]|jgi:RHS repeat-associated protein|nr:RHS repeat-associated core domain-containing protein [Verrucomicrobiae bacterium]